MTMGVPERLPSDADLRAVDEVLAAAVGRPAGEVAGECRDRGCLVEVVDLARNPWGEVTMDNRWWRVRIWDRAGTVERARRG